MNNITCADLLRTDCGTKNGIMASFQALIHNNTMTHIGMVLLSQMYELKLIGLISNGDTQHG